MGPHDDLDDMEMLNPIDLSAEAALELEELKQATRQDAPSLTALFAALQRPYRTTSNSSGAGISMLADARAYSVLRRAIEPYKPKVPVETKALEKMIAAYFDELLQGVQQHNQTAIDDAKNFCFSLTKSLISKQLREVYDKREAADNRYIYHVYI